MIFASLQREKERWNMCSRISKDSGHVCNPGTWEAEAGGPGVRGQLGQQTEMLSQRNNNKVAIMMKSGTGMVNAGFEGFPHKL